MLVGWMAVALALGELAADGMSGAPRSRSAAVRGTLASLLVLAAGALEFELRAWQWSSTALLELCVVAPWLFLRVPSPVPDTSADRRKHLAALGVLGAGALAAIAGPGTWRVETCPSAVEWLGRLPLAALRRVEPGRLVWGAGAVLLLLATGNGIVRATLQVAGTPPPRGGSAFKGGRYIGAIERTLIFGLAVAGEPTAAALVVSAKSILRFPELSQSARSTGESAQDAASGLQEVDALTEYFLLGSLSSWALALLAALLVRA